MGVYNTYAASKYVKPVTEATEDEIEFNTPDSSFAGIMETVCQIHETDQKVFESLLELDMMEIYLNEADEEEAPAASEDKAEEDKKEEAPKADSEKSSGGIKAKAKNLLTAIKKIIDRALEAIKGAVSKVIYKLTQAKNDKIVKEYVPVIVKSDKLKDFKIAELKVPTENAKVFLSKKLTFAKGETNKAILAMPGVKSAGDVADIKKNAKEALAEGAKIKEEEIFQVKKDVTFTPADIEKYAQVFSSNKHDQSKAIKEFANTLSKEIKNGYNMMVKAVSAKVDESLKDSVSEASYSIISDATKTYLKFQQTAIDMMVQSFKASRAVVLGAYRFCKGGAAPKAEEDKKEEKEENKADEAKQETVAFVNDINISNIMEASDLYVDGLMLV